MQLLCEAGTVCQSIDTYSQADATAARTRYLVPFAIATSKRNGTRGSRIRPATTVSGSPTTGIQLPKSDQRPYRLYQFWARSSWYSELGNHLLCLNRSKYRPRNQFITDPSTFPIVATMIKADVGWAAAAKRPTKTASDCMGRIVAAMSAEKTDQHKRSSKNQKLMSAFLGVLVIRNASDPNQRLKRLHLLYHSAILVS